MATWSCPNLKTLYPELLCPEFISPTRKRGLQLPFHFSPRLRVGLILKFTRQISTPPATLKTSPPLDSFTTIPTTA